MKLYRAIDFSRLAFMVDPYCQEYWNELILESGIVGNWWLRDDMSDQRKEFLKNVFDRQNQFFGLSIDFNSKVGGRFNPSRSFGCLYMSTCPTLAVLESLYHLFDGSRKLYKQIARAKDKLVTALNVHIPQCIDVLIVVFEIEVPDDLEVKEILARLDDFKKLCIDIGFKRYISDNFNEDFIFGNDYEISRIIGCTVHQSDVSILKIPSARLDVEYQHENGKSNVVIPEKSFKAEDVKLTGRTREYRCKVWFAPEAEGHKVEISATGSTTSSGTIFLQPWPTRRNSTDQIVVYTNSGVGFNVRDRKYVREVQVQKYTIP